MINLLVGIFVIMLFVGSPIIGYMVWKKKGLKLGIISFLVNAFVFFVLIGVSPTSEAHTQPQAQQQDTVIESVNEKETVEEHVQSTIEEVEKIIEPVKQEVEEEPELPVFYSSGTYIIGKDIQSGTYEIIVTSQFGAYWERLSGFSGELKDIIANGIVWEGDTAYVTISNSDKAFNITGGMLERIE